MSPIPPKPGTLTFLLLAALPAYAQEKATIHRDVYGVPHIYAATEPAGAYALALVQCEDYAKQVFENLRIASGRLAELQGEKGVESDRLVELWRIPELARQIWERSPASTQQILQAFADGLNHYRRAHPDEVPDALEATPLQIAAWLKFFLLRNSFGILNYDINNTLKTAAPPPFPTGQSSTFVLGGSRTASGKPILLIDPHWPSDGQSSWIEFHLHAGKLDVGGFAVPGMPFAGLGYTSRVAWGATAGGADSADAFELRVNPNSPRQYWFDGAWRDMTARQVEIPVKTATGVERRPVTLRESVHGPVVREEAGRTFAGAICGWKDVTPFEQWLRMNRAQSKAEFLDAAGLDQLTWINLTYATADGHLGYIQTGCAPIRPERPGPFVAVDGTRSAAMWTGVLPFAKLPQLHDPAAGWIQNCNTAANTVTSGLRMTESDFPPGTLFGHYEKDGKLWRGRGDRAAQVLARMTKATLADARDLAFDTYAPAVAIWRPALIAAYEKHAASTPDPQLDLKQAVDAFRHWDARVTRSSTAQTVFRFWREEYHRLRPDSLGDAQGYSYPKSDAEMADAMKALQAAVARMKKLYGSVLVPWGQVLRLRREGLDLALDGDAGAPFASEVMRATGPPVMTEDGRLVYIGGQVVTSVIELTSPIRVWTVVPFGQSRKPGTRHSTDQMRLFVESGMRPAWHDWASLRDRIESTRTVQYSPRAGLP